MINFYPLSHKISSFFLLKISSLLLLISFPFRFKHHIMIVIKCNRLMTELELSCPIELAFSNANFQLPYLYKISHRANWCLSHWVTTLSICFFFYLTTYNGDLIMQAWHLRLYHRLCCCRDASLFHFSRDSSTVIQLISLLTARTSMWWNN